MLNLDKPQQSALKLEMIANTSLAAAKGLSRTFTTAGRKTFSKQRSSD